jgi:hypothetical protein
VTDDPTITDLTAEEVALISERRREEAAHAAREAERIRRAQAVQDLVHERLGGTSWVTADGRRLDVSEMTPKHATNTLRLLERRWTVGLRPVLPVPPRMLGYDTPADTVLGRALAARSKQRATWRERRADKRAAAEWEAGKEERLRLSAEREAIIRSFEVNQW